MGSGKSYIGRLLAAKMGLQFVDLDSIIESTEEAKIAQIFVNEGETYFRQIESQILRGVQKWDNMVVATGGGAPCFHNSMDWMNENGLTIYLKATAELLLSRLKNESEHRPILGGRTDLDLLDFIKSKIVERSPFYSKATLTIEQETDGEHIVEEIINALYERLHSN